MRKQAFLLVFCAGSILCPAIGNSQIFPISTMTLHVQSDDIDLRGRIEPGEIRRVEKTITASLQTGNIRAQFHYDVGAVQITITNDSGTIIYTSSILSSTGEISISTLALPSGNYTITFTASTGELTGDFTL